VSRLARFTETPHSATHESHFHFVALDARISVTMTRTTLRGRSPRALHARAAYLVRATCAAASLFVAASCGGTTEPTKVASVTVTPNTIAVPIGATQQFVATTYDSFSNALTGRVVTWSSSNTSVVTVSSSGLASGVASGTATITATSEGQAGAATVSVAPPPVVSVAITPATSSITEVQTVQLSAVTKVADSSVVTNRPVTWTSSTPAAATISSTGLLTGVAPGTTTITATSEGVKATMVVTVTVDPCNPTFAPSIVAGQTINGALTADDCYDNTNTAYIDAYKMVIVAPATIDLVLHSSVFDTYLLLLVPNSTGTGFVTFSENNDSNAGGTTDAELKGFVPAGTYYIVATSNLPNVLGAYTLKLTSPVIAGLSNIAQLERATISVPTLTRSAKFNRLPRR
jgi:hypothetical protein